MGIFGSILLGILALIAAVLVCIFVLVPILKGIGWMIGGIFKVIGWLLAHIFDFVVGMLSDAVRFLGAIIAMIVLTPLALLNVIIGRWSAAGHFAGSVKREFKVAGLCLYRVVLKHPLKFVLLHGLLEGVEQRVPEAMAAAPTADRPSRRTGQFPGYTIVGSLRSGGSGAKLYVAQPDDSVRARHPGMPERVVIKSFAIAEGSSLPQIVREPRALECAKQLGLVFDHDMDEHRFYYVMPFHAGDHLGIITRQLHGETDGRGLGSRQFATALGYVGDLLHTLSVYHRGGLWHKDVKPENIIVHDGRAHLVDLGLITPLRSAMTLTTHGTEYFRDPEMVRQALRGVKVHQVNGAKFDIYAAGAVLYFLTENEFPPHGALSRFQKKSPDSLKWIIRRAMADYSHRYESADEMLADLRHVAVAPDSSAVRPADLPSMRGPSIAAAELEEALGEVEHEAASAAASMAGAGSPRPPADERAYAAPAAPASPQRRPRLRITNWWTGAYRVEEPAIRAAAPQGSAFSEQARALRHEASQLRQQVRAGTVSARRAAQEQLKAARARAKEIRRTALQHKPRRPARAVAERQPSLMLSILGGLAVVLIVMCVAMFAIIRSPSGRVKMPPMPGVTLSSPEMTTTILLDNWRDVTSINRPFLVVPSVDEPDDPAVVSRLASLVESYRVRGLNAVINERLVDDDVRGAVERWCENRNRADDKVLEAFMERHDLYGILHITEQGLLGDRDWDLDSMQITSSARGAKDRVYRVMNAPPAQPFLVVNDHPTKHNPDTAASIARHLARWSDGGYRLIIDGDDELEAAVRAALPSRPIEQTTAAPEALKIILDEQDLGGVLYVDVAPGDGPATGRILIVEIGADDAADADDTPPEEDATPPEGLLRGDDDSEAALLPIAA